MWAKNVREVALKKVQILFPDEGEWIRLEGRKCPLQCSVLLTGPTTDLFIY